MTEPEVSPIAERLEQITQELRRQGRAAVAAQAAAESCLSGVEQLGSMLSEKEVNRSDSADASALSTLLPLFDALMRVAKEAAEIEPAGSVSWPLSLLKRDNQLARLHSLRHGVLLLDSAFRQAMDHLGVVVDQRVGVKLDPDIHRVVEARNPSFAAPPDTIVEVVRCGYRWQGSVLREADVVATRSQQQT